MIVLKITIALLGVAFALFGYFIFFGGHYSLINGFDEAFQAGRRDRDYAKRVGLTELAIGVVLLVVAIVLIVLA